MSLAACLADVDQVVLAVADDADGGAALDRDHSHLTGRETKGGVLAFLGHELCGIAGSADHLAALAREQLDVVYESTDRDDREREAVAEMHFNFRTVHQLVADLQAFRSQDVSLLAVCVADKSDVGGAVRIVLDRLDDCRNTVLRVALEVDDSVSASCSAPAEAARDLALVVAARGLPERLGERFFRLLRSDLGEIGTRHVPSRRGIRLISFDSHD